MLLAAQAMRLLTLALILAAGSARAGTLDHSRPLDGQTTVFGMPTGELLRPGEVQLQQTELALFGVSVGLGEHFDVSAAMPWAPLFGGAQLRFGLFKHGFPIQLALGAGFSFGLLEKNTWVGELFSGALSVKTGRLNLRLSSTATRLGEPLKAVQLVDAGVSFAPWAHLAFCFDVVYLRWISRTAQPELNALGQHFVLGSGVSAISGIKIIGGTFTADLGLLWPLKGGALPMVNFTQRI